jgi:purine-binding chemotaxis protein CheW
MSETPLGKFEHMGPAALEILRRRAESLSSESQDEVQVDQMSLLLFRLGDEWYAVPIESVREIYNDYEVTPIPGVPDYIPGIVNIRGEIVSVTDLGALMRIPARPEAVVVEQASAIVASTEECVSALLVAEIGDIVEVAADALEPPLAVADRGQADWVSGSIYLDGRLVGVIDLEKILTPIGEEA